MAVTGILSIGNYTFPVRQQEYNDNFSNVVPLTQRVVGMDGGFDLDGDEASPNQIGRITFGFWLIAGSRSEMDALRDAVRMLPTLGRQIITYQPTDTNDVPRYIYGKVNAINMGQQKGQHTDLWQRVQLILQCPEPVWTSDAGYWWRVLDDGSGSFIPADGTYGLDYNALEFTFTSTPYTAEIDYPGSAVAFPVVALTVQDGTTRSLSNWAIKRIVNNVVLDEVSYDAPVNAESGSPAELLVDAGQKMAWWNGSPAWSGLTYKHPDMLRIVPLNPTGETTISLTVTGTVSGTGNLILRVWYKDTWR